MHSLVAVKMKTNKAQNACVMDAKRVCMRFPWVPGTHCEGCFVAQGRENNLEFERLRDITARRVREEG